jgi:cysteine dioxygenase
MASPWYLRYLFIRRGLERRDKEYLMTRYIDLDHFVKTLETMAAHALPVDDVQAYLEQTRITPETFEPYLHYKPERYTRHLVHKTEAFEVLVICWDIGQQAPIHGHDGKLRFTNYRLVSETPLQLAPLSAAIDGGVGYLDGPADIHAVQNCVQFGAPAASLHVYSRPYAECDIYDLTRGKRQRSRMSYDTIYGKPASAS